MGKTNKTYKVTAAFKGDKLETEITAKDLAEAFIKTKELGKKIFGLLVNEAVTATVKEMKPGEE